MVHRLPEAGKQASPLTGDAYFEKQHKNRPYEVSVHADMLKIKRRAKLTQLPQINKQRGTIKGFSRSSRKRMIEFMASARLTGSMLFVTLTYPDNFPTAAADWHRHFEAFRDRFENHYTNWRALWRIELIDRKSGENTGAIAPHWHLIVFLPDETESTITDTVAAAAQRELAVMWYEIVASGDEKHLERGVDVSPVRSRKHAYSYVAKYVAKTSNDIMEIGRRWGRIGTFDTSASEVISLTFDEYVILKRIIKRWMRGRGGKYHKRFARFTPTKGCSVLGMGDAAETSFEAFIWECWRQIDEKRLRERGFGE